MFRVSRACMPSRNAPHDPERFILSDALSSCLFWGRGRESALGSCHAVHKRPANLRTNAHAGVTDARGQTCPKQVGGLALGEVGSESD